MHAPYAAQYCVIGGSGAGKGGSFTSDPAVVCASLAAAVSEAPLSALVADAAVAAMASLAPAVLPAAVVAAGALAAGAVAPAGILAPIGLAEKLLEGKGGRDGTPVDEVLDAGGLRGGICGSRTMSTLVCLFAAAKHSALSTLCR
jgi:hypothetical protein